MHAAILWEFNLLQGHVIKPHPWPLNVRFLSTPTISKGTKEWPNDLLTFCRGEVHKKREVGGWEKKPLFCHLLSSHFRKHDGKSKRDKKPCHSTPANVIWGCVTITNLQHDLYRGKHLWNINKEFILLIIEWINLQLNRLHFKVFCYYFIVVSGSIGKNNKLHINPNNTQV